MSPKPNAITAEPRGRETKSTERTHFGRSTPTKQRLLVPENEPISTSKPTFGGPARAGGAESECGRHRVGGLIEPARQALTRGMGIDPGHDVGPAPGRAGERDGLAALQRHNAVEIPSAQHLPLPTVACIEEWLLPQSG